MPTEVDSAFQQYELALSELIPVGQGRTADVYAWGDGQVVKLFVPGYVVAAVLHEAASTRWANEHGLPAPRVGELVSIAERHGIVYERILGPSMGAVLKAQPLQAARLGRQLGELHARVHQVSGAGLPCYHDWIARSIVDAEELAPELRQRLLERLRAIPEGAALCHGDLHLDNVVLSPRGPVIIDWMNARCGDPLADVARSLLMLRLGMSATPRWSLKALLFRLARAGLDDGYLAAYRRMGRLDDARLDAWLPLMAAARLKPHRPEQERAALLWYIAQALDGSC